jgi:hypothetical protein
LPKSNDAVRRNRPAATFQLAYQQALVRFSVHTFRPKRHSSGQSSTSFSQKRPGTAKQNHKEELAMRRTITRATLVAIALFLFQDYSQSARAEIPPGLFDNYYVGPPGVPAQLYVSPRPTPAYVGHTWITYPPFAPHEYLYRHRRAYYRYTPGGYTAARVWWY